MRRICEIMVTLDFILRLVLYSHEDCFIQHYFSDCISLVNLVQEKSTKTSFIGNNVNALIKTSNCEILSFISLRQFRKLQHLLCLFGFQ